MSMAFESARLAVEPLLSYSREEKGWAKASAEIARLLLETFKRRLFWAGFLHQLMFSRLEPASRIALCAEPLWRTTFALTR